MPAPFPAPVEMSEDDDRLTETIGDPLLAAAPDTSPSLRTFVKFRGVGPPASLR